jgi:uncharacterized membrane protein
MSGMLVLVPVAITFFILNFILSFVTAFARPVLRPWIKELPDYVVTLIALVTTALIVYAVGQVTTHLVGRRLIHLGEKLLLRLPLVKSIYASSKQVVNTFSASNKTAIQAVVLIEYPRRGSLALGFVTGSILNPQGRRLYRVFVATTPNPTSGFLLLLPEEEVQFTDISVEDGVKMLVSGGMLSPARYQLRENPICACGERAQDAPPA